MALAVGRIAPQQEVLARWAYSEIVSPRVGGLYHQRAELAGATELALGGIPFDQIPRDHHPDLAAAATFIRATYSAIITQHPRFLLAEWDKEKVGAVFVDKWFNTPHRDIPMKFRDFVRWNRNVSIDGSLHPPDPRIAADAIPRGTPPLTEEAPIVTGVAPGFLVDGYLRCLLFLRDAPETAKLPMWVGLN